MAMVIAMGGGNRSWSGGSGHRQVRDYIIERCRNASSFMQLRRQRRAEKFANSPERSSAKGGLGSLPTSHLFYKALTCD